MRRSIITTFALVVLCLAATQLSAQSLLDNEYYKMALALKEQSDAALAAGDYDGAASLAADAEENFKKSDAYVEEMLGRYRANGWLQRATEQLAQAKAGGAAKRAEDLYTEAADDVEEAAKGFGLPRDSLLRREDAGRPVGVDRDDGDGRSGVRLRGLRCRENLREHLEIVACGLDRGVAQWGHG